MERPAKFCINCKQRLAYNLFGKVQAYEFEDGFRCTSCAELYVKKLRGK